MPDNVGLLTAIAPHDSLSAWYWVNPLADQAAVLLEDDIANAKVAGIMLLAY